MLYIEGVIIDLNVNCKTNPRTDYEVYSKVKTKDGKILSFNSKTRISGCKFKYLCTGDRVLIRSISEVSHHGRHKIQFVKVLEILDLEKKWETILSKDKKLKKHRALKQIGTVIVPEIIKLDENEILENPEKLNDFVINHKFECKQHQLIMEKYSEGEPIRDIRDLTTYKSYDGVRKVIQKYLKLWGIE